MLKYVLFGFMAISGLHAKVVELPVQSLEIIDDCVIWKTHTGYYHIRTLYPSKDRFLTDDRSLTSILNEENIWAYKAMMKQASNSAEEMDRIQKSLNEHLRALLSGKKTRLEMRKSRR